jgi:hypothetical protein
MPRLDPLISEFETDEQAISDDRWFRTKVLEAMSGTKPRLPHDEAVARGESMLAEKRKARADRPME